MTIKTEDATAIREGILMARRNYSSELSLTYEHQVPRGSKIQQRAYHRTWVRLVNKFCYPPRKSYTRFNPRMHGEAQLAELHRRLLAGEALGL